jgi:chromate reductase
MSSQFKVAVLVGSLRSASVTKKVAHAMMGLAPASLHCELIDIGNIPLYNEDMEGKVPSWGRFRNQMFASDAILFFTPEYNRSVPACLKNLIDVGSRPPSNNVWNGKPAGVVSVTPYKLGGMAANLAVRQALVYVNLPVMQQPEAYIGEAAGLFDDDDSLNNEDSKRFFAMFMGAFAEWVARLAAKP